MSHRHGSFTQMCLTRFVATGLALAVAASAYAQTPVTPPGSGTEGDPYLISEVGHLIWMGDTAAASSGKYYSLTTDIDASATAGWNDPGTDTTILEGFKPIGTYSNPDTRSFRGIFDGNGHTISGLIINRPGADYVGLFGSVGSGGQVRNLGLVGGAVTGDYHVGGLVGLNLQGTVSNCYATGAVTGEEYVGGLVGRNYYGTVSNCHATGAVTGTGYYIGGLVGDKYEGTVSNCYATGAVTGQEYVGGLVGRNCSGTVLNCYATGAVTAGYGDVSGLVGLNDDGTVSNSYWDMQTSGQSTSDGGAGKTTAEMKQQATFVGWDFTSIWGIVEGDSYPYLRFSPPPFKLAVHASGPGSVTVDPPSVDGTYAPGTVVTLTAVPNGPSDAFIRWAGAAPVDSLTVGVVMDIHRSVTAMFLPRIEINSLADLARIGNEPDYPLAALYVLTADIDASATAGWNDAGTDTTVLEGFKPIGTGSGAFGGVFDGNGHTISGLIINRPGATYVGLFGCVGVGGQVRNLGLVGGAVTGNQYVGGLVGLDSSGTVSNCYATGAVTGSDSVGGLVGYNYQGTVSNCYATGAVSGYNLVGGLVGENYYGPVSNCYATGAVTGSNSGVGGLVGYNSTYGTISNCYATGAVTGTGRYVGGLVGYNSTYGTISNCYATGAVSGTGNYVGGLVGENYYGPVSNCYATGAVTGREYVGGLVGINYYDTVSNCYATGAVTGSNSVVGGLVGYNSTSGTVSNCYATGAVTGEGYRVGGLAGINSSSGTVSNCYATGTVTGYGIVGGLVGDNGGTVSNCYATGAVTGEEYRVGGLAGINSSSGTVSNCYATGTVTGYGIVGGLVGDNGGTVSNSYWDMQTSGQSTSAGGTGKTTAEMKQQATFVGWDFTDIWGIEENLTYPFFLNEPQAPVLTAALSRKAHGSVGDFDIDLPIGGNIGDRSQETGDRRESDEPRASARADVPVWKNVNPAPALGARHHGPASSAGVECRSGGPTQVVLTFDGPADGVAVQASAGNVDAVLVEGDQATVSLSGVPNATCLTLTVTAACQQGETEVYIRCLAGDATGDGTVNILDLVQVRNQLNQTVSPLNFRADVNADGAINILDLVNVRNHLNTSATCEPPAPEGDAPPADPA